MLRQGTSAADDAARPPAPSLPGDAGFWTFIAADATLFALLFFQFSLDRSSQVAIFDAGQRELLVSLGAVNTLVLVTSSLLLAQAVRSVHRGDTRTGLLLMAGTIALGVVFAALKLTEYGIETASGHTLSTSSFFMYYFVITGIHLVHLIVGIVALAVIAFRLGRNTDPKRHRVVLECGAAYWHLIDLLWMFIFPMLYLAR